MTQHRSESEIHLERGFPWLRFDADLEGQYQQSYLRSVRFRVVACILIMISFSLWAAISNRADAPPSDVVSRLDHLRFWIVRPLSLYLIISALVPALYYGGWLFSTPLILSVTGTISSFTVAALVVDGNVHAFVGMVAGLLAVYILVGMLFWQMLATGAIIAAAYILSLMHHGADPNIVGFESTVILTLTAVTLLFSYSLELSQRVGFLQKRVLQDLGSIDSLTGLKNRRIFDETLDMLWKQGLRDDKPIGLLIIDVDHFKAFNDHYGHQAGDRCLSKIGSVLQRAGRRPLDVAARIGGEEFAVLFYASTEAHVTAVGYQIEKEVRDLAIPHGWSNCAACVSVSIGGAQVLPTIGQTPEGLQQFVDEALYLAKANGRSRLVWRDPANEPLVKKEFQFQH